MVRACRSRGLERRREYGLASGREEPLSNRDPLPRGVVRDLLGITRALYRAELTGAPDALQRARLARLEEIGKMFRSALELSKVEPDTIGHRAAWGWAEQGAAALGDFVGENLPVAPAVRAAAAKLRA
jgi:hypothetical protein